MRTAVVLLAFLVTPALRAGPEYPNRGPDIYDPQTDGFVLINAALQQARAENKRVLLDADGWQLVNQETSAFEKSGQAETDDPAKVLAFLEKWAPPARFQS